MFILRAITHSYRTKFSYAGRTVVGRKKPPPFNIRLMKGAVHVIVRREFVEYVIHDVRAKTFLDWSKDTRKKVFCIISHFVTIIFNMYRDFDIFILTYFH